ncbi:MAG: agmatine deiminase family protein [Bacteroidota bacterium]
MLKFLSFFGLLFCLVISQSCKTVQIQAPAPSNPETTLTSSFPRMAAEWEPATGVFITWPLAIPHKLVIELAKDTRVYTLVPSLEEKQSATTWFKKWGIGMEKIEFIVAPQGVDSWWTRDWGPHAVYSVKDGMRMADGMYVNSTPVSGLDCNDKLRHLFTKENEKGEVEIIPTTTDDLAPYEIGKALNIEVVELPFVFTGGNVIADGRGSVFSTCVITNENRFMKVSDEAFFNSADALLGVDQYRLISNFEENGIQHIDCYLKLIDEETLFVLRPPKDHPSFQVYEDIVNNELAKMKNAYGRPYKILRLDTDIYHGRELAAYTNSLILNTTVYVPLFGINQDVIALKQWQDALPGYTVKGFLFELDKEPILDPKAQKHYYKIGWNSGDALHCRTRAMWDPQMLYMSVDRLPENVAHSSGYTVQANVIDYSNKGFVDGSLLLHWREAGGEWGSEPLRAMAEKGNWLGIIPSQEPGDLIEYYISAKSHSGREEMMPRSAPAGVYRFRINGKE